MCVIVEITANHLTMKSIHFIFECESNRDFSGKCWYRGTKKKLYGWVNFLKEEHVQIGKLIEESVPPIWSMQFQYKTE